MEEELADVEVGFAEKTDTFLCLPGVEGSGEHKESFFFPHHGLLLPFEDSSGVKVIKDTWHL